MDINLPLVLFLATAITGFFYLVDIVLFRKDRLKGVEEALAPFHALSDEEKSTDEAYNAALERASKEPLVIEYSKSFFPVLALVFVLRSFIMEPFQIPSESMLPTLEVGDFIVVNKFSYGIRLPIIRTKVMAVNDPKRGDVMVFFPPHDERYFIKRVIGLPGDKIQYTDHQLYINDKPVPSELVRVEASVRGEPCNMMSGTNQIIKETIDERTFETRKCSVPGNLSRNGTWVVPDGHYFMMGDNRDNSLDSRKWLYVPEKNIVGNAVGIWMHWESLMSIPSFSRVGGI